MPQEEPDMALDPLKDACTLAHECGHFLSDREGAQTQAYCDAIDADRVVWAEGQAAVLAEEERAWDLGRDALARLGCTEWAYFDSYRAKCVQTYREGFARQGRPAP